MERGHLDGLLLSSVTQHILWDRTVSYSIAQISTLSVRSLTGRKVTWGFC